MAKSKKNLDEVLVIPDPNTLNATTVAEYSKRGWLFFTHKDAVKAEADLRKALEMDDSDADTWYALGLVLKSTGATSQAIVAFDKATEKVILTGSHDRIAILTRLAHGQVNQIKTGDWNLEKEIWKQK